MKVSRQRKPVAIVHAAGRRSAARTREPKLRSILSLTALAIFAQESLSAGISDWTNVGPVGGGLRLAVDPQNAGFVYAGTGGGVFKSKDGGAGWNNAGLNGFAVGALIVDPQKPTILYARTPGPDVDGDPIRLFKSTDGGDSWNESDSSLPIFGPDTLAIVSVPRAFRATAPLPDGKVLVVGGDQLAKLLYLGAGPDYPGYNQVNFLVPRNIAPGAAVRLRLTYLGRPSNEVTIGVQ